MKGFSNEFANYKVPMKLKSKRIIFIIIYYVLLIIVLTISRSLARYANNVSVISKVDVAKFNFKITDVVQG